MKRKQANQAGSAAATAPAAKAAAMDSDRQMQMGSDSEQQIQIIQIASVTTMAAHAQQQDKGKRALEARIMEISPFEATPTFKCGFCPKRSQNRERMERHVAQEHPRRQEGEGQEQPAGYKQMSRDQGC